MNELKYCICIIETKKLEQKKNEWLMWRRVDGATCK